MIESDAAYDAEPLSQGDIFQWQARTHGCNYGVIVTADCDIAFGKYGSHLTYVPVLTLHEYLATHFLPDKVRQAAFQVLSQIVNSVWRLQQASRPEFSRKLSDEAMSIWLQSTDLASILSSLGVTDSSGKNTSKLEGLVAIWRELDERSSDSTDAIGQIAALARARDTSLAAIHKQVHSHVISLPGDRMFLSSIDGSNQTGYVVMLRNMREIEGNRIAVRPAQESSSAARRMSRLLSPYRYRLTQQLGEVFSSIGLPVPYEESRVAVLSKSFNLVQES